MRLVAEHQIASRMSLQTNRFAHIEPEHDPRCLSRSRVLQPLFRSPMTVRDLNANRDDDDEESRGGASDAVSAWRPTPSEPMRTPAASSTRAAGLRRRAHGALDQPPPFRVTDGRWTPGA
jgi:hypothetical protein